MGEVFDDSFIYLFAYMLHAAVVEKVRDKSAIWDMSEPSHTTHLYGLDDLVGETIEPENALSFSEKMT